MKKQGPLQTVPRRVPTRSLHGPYKYPSESQNESILRGWGMQRSLARSHARSFALALARALALALEFRNHHHHHRIQKHTAAFVQQYAAPAFRSMSPPSPHPHSCNVDARVLRQGRSARGRSPTFSNSTLHGDGCAGEGGGRAGQRAGAD